MNSSLFDRRPEDLIALAQDPDAYAALDRDALDQLLVSAVLIAGNLLDYELVYSLDGLYRHWAEAAPVADRMETLRAMIAGVAEDQATTFTYLPFFRGDVEVSIVSTAAIRLAVETPAKSDPMAVPAALVAMVRAGEVRSRAGAFAGLLVLGDARVVALLDELRGELTPAELETVASAQTGFLNAATTEFWLGWLEAVAPIPERRNEKAIVALALVNLVDAGARVADPVVFDAERVFGLSNGEEPLRVARTWTVGEYLATIEPRFAAIAAAESDPKVMPHVLGAWRDAAAGKASGR